MAARAYAALLGRSRLLGVGSASALFLAAWSVLHVGFFAYATRRLFGDVRIYENYGELMRSGYLPYRDFPVEYPPAALPVFVAPTFASDYHAVFELLMLVCGVCMVVLVAITRPGSPGMWLVALSPLLAGSLVLVRFDLLPTALATAGVVALLRDRHRLGWAALGAATAAKLFPLVLVPLAAVWTLRRRGPKELAWAAALGAAVLVAAFAPWVVLAPRGIWASVEAQMTRPLQIESLGAAMMMTAHRAGIEHTYRAGIERSSVSVNASGDAAGPLIVLLSTLLVSSLLTLWIAFARGPADRARFARYVAACLAVTVAFGKVLSPQYLIWLLPFVALVYGRRGWAAIGLLVCAFLLTYVWIPSRFEAYVYDYHLAWVVLLRDLVVVALAAVLALSPPAHARAHSP